MKKLIPIVLSIAVLGMGSCKKVGKLAEKVSTEGTMTAKINGNDYKAGRVIALPLSNSLRIEGEEYSSDKQLTISIQNFTGSGTYAVDLMNNQIDYYDTEFHTGKTGEINIEKTGDKSVKGTFHFENADSSYRVTDGNFEVSWE